MKGFTGFSMALISLFASHLTHAVDFNQDINVTRETSVPVRIDAPQYFRGYISSNIPLERVMIIDPQGQVEKNLSGTNAQEKEVFWLANKSGKYHLYIKPKDNDTGNVSITLHTLPLKKNQFVSPPQTINSPLIKKTAEKIQQGMPAAEEHFWEEIQMQGTPLIENSPQPNTVFLTFLYKGDSNIKNVRVLGAPYDGHAHLSQLPGSNIWFKTYQVPENTRFSYRIAPNVPQLDEDNWQEQRRAVLATAQPDPLNSSPYFGLSDDLFGSASTITLNKAPSDHYTQALGNARGTITHYRYSSQVLNNSRKISIYSPNNIYRVNKHSPVVILFDGDDYLSKVPTSLILDNLIADAKIPPMRAVFINTPIPSMREKELTPNKEFADFLANEFKPWLCTEHDICSSAENTILSGSSYGGLSAMYIAFKHPDEFGKVLSQSGSFWWSPNIQKKPGTKLHNWMADQFEAAPHKAIDIYMNAGSFETKPEFSNILGTNRYLYNILKNKGYHVDFIEVSSGHDYFSWRVMLADGLIKLFNHNNPT